MTTKKFALIKLRYFINKTTKKFQFLKGKKDIKIKDVADTKLGNIHQTSVFIAC